MISIFEYYNSLNESFSSNFARMIKQDLETSGAARKNKADFKSFIDRIHISNIAWDKVEDSDFEKWDDPEVLLRLIRALKANKEDFIGAKNKRVPIKDRNIVVFGYRGDKLNYIYTSYWTGMTDMSDGSMIDAPKTITDDLKDDCDTWYVLNIGNNETSKLKRDRGNNQANMIPSLDNFDRAHKHTRQGVLGKDAGGIDLDNVLYSEMGEFTNYCKRLVDYAKDRWKKILAENQFKRTNDSKAIDDLVKKCMDGYLAAMQEVMKNPKEYSTYGNMKTLQNIIQGEAKGYGGGKHVSAYITGGLLKTYQSYVEAVKELTEGSSYPEMYVKQRNNAEATIKAYYAKLKTLLKEFKVNI